MFDPFSILVGLSAVSAVGKALEPMAERFDRIDRYNDAIEELERMGLHLGVRNAVLADNDEHMQRHAARMANGGYNLADERDLYDFCEDMRVQLKVGEYADRVFRKAGSVCKHCGQTITSVEQIEGGRKNK